MQEHIVIPETQDSEAMFLQDAGSGEIRFLPFQMVSTIELNDETLAQAAKVNDKTSNGVLTTEFKTEETVRAKIVPKPLFGICGTLA